MPSNVLGQPLQACCYAPMTGFYREVKLLFDLVAPRDLKELHVVEMPSEQIEKRCDMWIAEFLLYQNRKGIVPPTDLRKWLGVRVYMARIFLDRHIELKCGDKKNQPNSKTNLRTKLECG